ncbi:MAG TPA: outer membrane lipoprotein chaperone LolA [Gemmatimonadaceae bacterium]|nr:outer membrane lipoprotein chaperone LolA [Gemmatimonadaceae bacterium]
MTRWITGVAVAAMLANASPAGAQDAAQVAVDRAVAAYEGMKTLRATFEQTLTNPLTGSTMHASGEFQRQQPNLISVRFTDPAGDLIVVDGSAIWMYLPSTNPGQAFKMPMDAAGAMAFDPAQLMRDPGTRFEITDGGSATIGSRSVRVVKLAPGSRTEPFTSATLWIDDADGLIRQFEVVEQTGITRRIRMLTIQPNAVVQRASFSFTPPRGVQVVDQTGVRG